MRHDVKHKTGFKCQKGASAVEFAIVLPLLLLFIFGIIEFGILFYNKAVITNASREGARTAILYTHPPNGVAGVGNCRMVDPSDVATVVHSYCANNLINFSGSKIPSVVTTGMVPTADGQYYRRVSVTFDYNFLLLPNILGAFFGGSLSGPITLSAVTQMRTECQPE